MVSCDANRQRDVSLYSTATQTIHVGSSRWLRPPTPQFGIGDTSMLVSKNAKICITPTPTPNASRLNIGGVGSPTKKSIVGHVDFMLFVHHFLPWLVKISQHKRRFRWNTGFRLVCRLEPYTIGPITLIQTQASRVPTLMDLLYTLS